nr:hypothetical protein [Marinicella sp. W31]MDC2878857.1 hypothetical protein [Marinicella sp. W31]
MKRKADAAAGFGGKLQAAAGVSSTGLSISMTTRPTAPERRPSSAAASVSVWSAVRARMMSRGSKTPKAPPG